MEPAKQVEVIHLSDYVNVLAKRRTLIFAFVILTVSLTMLLSFLMQPIYQASSKMVIDKEQTSSPITGEKMDYSSYQSQLLTFNTHFKLIKSKPVLMELIKALKLDEKSEEETSAGQSMVATMFKRLKANVKLILGKDQDELSPEKKLELLIEDLQKTISISQVRDTRLLSISVKNSDPVLARDMAKTLAQKYIEFDMSSRMASSKNNLEWMNNELYRLKKRLEDDEQKFLEYKQMNKLFSVKGKQKVIDQKIEEFNNEYLVARNKKLELDAKLEEIAKMAKGGDDLIHVRSIISNPSIDTIYANLTKLEMETTRLSKVFKHKHPKMVQNAGEIEKTKKKLKAELQKELDNLRSERAVFAAREKVMGKNIAEFEDDALDASGKELRYTILQRNMTTSQNLYDTLVSKVKESGMLSNSSTSNIRIVEEGAVPVYPVSPNKKKNLLLSLLLGLFGGVGIAFFLEYLDQTVRTEEDVQNYLKLPVLSIIPMADASDKIGA